MSNIERDLIVRCLHLIYGQFLTGDTDSGLKSMERLIILIRYITKSPDMQTSVSDELKVVQEVFRIYRMDNEAELELSFENIDPQMHVPHNSIVYEICKHGMELIHNGNSLSKLLLLLSGNQISYVFTDIRGRSFGGTIYDEGFS